MPLHLLFRRIEVRNCFPASAPSMVNDYRPVRYHHYLLELSEIFLPIPPAQNADVGFPSSGAAYSEAFR